MSDEVDNGIESDDIDMISANLIIERNPTCYGTDKRWANHLYPVFLTESFVKSILFMALSLIFFVLLFCKYTPFVGFQNDNIPDLWPQIIIWLYNSIHNWR